MLSQFSVENFKSFKNKITLDMKSVSKDLLSLGVIYGFNGVGKSNALLAIQCLIDLVVEPIRIIFNGSSEIQLKIEPFKFSKENINKATKFEICFIVSGFEYRYILHVQDKYIIYESLDQKDLSAKRISNLFIRNEKEIKLDRDFSKLKISKDISNTLPLLSYLGITYTNNKIVCNVVDWFLHQIDFYTESFDLLMKINEDKNLRSTFLKFLKNIDIDIYDFYIDELKDKIYTKHLIKDKEYMFSLQDESKGIQKLFYLLPYIINSLKKGSVLIIDDMSTNIHSKIVKYILGLYSSKEINKKGAQLIFSSCDSSVMNSAELKKDEIWVVKNKIDQSSALYSSNEFNKDFR